MIDINTEHRQIIIQKAREKYIDSDQTKNITEALRMYLENDAGPDEQIPLFITTPELHQMRKLLEIERPRCDDCEEELHLKVNARDPEGKAYPTAWVCKSCGIEYYSELSPADWLKELHA
ncbi:MAG: hypothetical protein WC373_06825 [Smithella sp.]|jgi:uncharacterized protein with PIN domain